ncbi:MAG: hypothetical protein ACLFPI_01130 [Desulfobacterales bacterium]
MDEHYLWVTLTRTGPWQVQMEARNLSVAVVYYLAKMDHLWCVPALLFMYLGLRRLNLEDRSDRPSSQKTGGGES